MREVELKSVVDDLAARRMQVERAGGHLDFAGALTDVRYDTAAGDLVRRDHVLRLRVYGGTELTEAHLDWKGETRYEGGYKVREEISTSIGDPEALATMLRSLGFQIVREIEREITQYTLHGATVRFEHYPRMDDLVEVEGTPEAIEKAIDAMGLPRGGFSTGRLTNFIVEYESRTGRKAAISGRELSGDYPYGEASAQV